MAKIKSFGINGPRAFKNLPDLIIVDDIDTDQRMGVCGGDPISERFLTAKTYVVGNTDSIMHNESDFKRYEDFLLSIKQHTRDCENVLRKEYAAAIEHAKKKAEG